MRRRRRDGLHIWPRAPGGRRAVARGTLADVFSGTGRVARAAERAGLRAVRWDINLGAQHDLTVKANESRLHRELRSGSIAAASFAIPCQTFSIANNSSGPIRSVQFPRGLGDLPPEKACRVRLGNRLLAAAVRLLHTCGRMQIPCCVENPRSSYLWCDARLQHVLQKFSARFITLDMCAFGTKYKKPTQLAFCFCDDLGALEFSRCKGKHGKCSFRAGHHIHLQGSSTRRAAECPTKLASSIVDALLSSRRHA